MKKSILKAVLVTALSARVRVDGAQSPLDLDPSGVSVGPTVNL